MARKNISHKNSTHQIVAVAAVCIVLGALAMFVFATFQVSPSDNAKNTAGGASCLHLGDDDSACLCWACWGSLCSNPWSRPNC